MTKPQSGQTLLEVLVALAAVIIVLGAVTTAVLLSLKQSVGSSETTRSSQLAQEGLELLTPLASTLPTGTVSCLDSTGTLSEQTNCATTPNLEGTYQRMVMVETDPTQCASLKKVTVIVSWRDATCQNASFCHSVPLTTCL